MTSDEKRSAAQALLAIPLFDELFDDMEAAAVNLAVAAQPTDHDARQAHIAELRALRNLRSRIGALAANPAPVRRPPA